MTLYILKRRTGWFWRLVARNGKKRAIGGEPFSSERAARRAFRDLHSALVRVVAVRVVSVPARTRAGKGRRA